MNLNIAKMLVVDDEPRNRKLIEGYLEAEGHQILSAQNGIEALEMIRAERPDVVLLDVMMPGMTGYEVCKVIKEDPELRAIQVMLVTALDGSTKKVEGLDTGADDYVTKPVRRDEFLAKVRALVRARSLLLDLERAHTQLRARNEELTLKKMLAQSLVHDLKSPLSAVIGNLDLLNMKLNGQHEHLVNRSKAGATRMLKMILNLLDVEALDEGQINVKLERVDAVQVAREAVEEAKPAAAVSKIELDLDTVQSAWVEADRSMFRRVIDNLISNAISHAPSNSSVELTLMVRAEGVELAVRDHGPGVPESQRETIFDKYQQVCGGEYRGATNRGLGLTFCQLAIEAHGGTIWVEEAPGGGARFRLILPDAAALESEGEAWNRQAVEA